MSQESTTYYNLISDISSLLKRSDNSFAFIIDATELLGEVNMAHRAKLISDAEAKYLTALLAKKRVLTK